MTPETQLLACDERIFANKFYGEEAAAVVLDLPNEQCCSCCCCCCCCRRRRCNRCCCCWLLSCRRRRCCCCALLCVLVAMLLRLSPIHGRMNGMAGHPFDRRTADRSADFLDHRSSTTKYDVIMIPMTSCGGVAANSNTDKHQATTTTTTNNTPTQPLRDSRSV